MSYMVARMQKMKVGNLGGAYKHNERIFEKHANKDIDTSRSHLNYELTDRDRSVSYEKQIKDYVNENKISNRAIRKDAVLCDEWIITSDKSFFEKLSEEETREFFETAKNYFAENYGEDNIAYASVHLDESTPHMHMGVVPFQDGKLSSKAMFDKEELKKIQEDLPKYMNEHGFELERGGLNSEAKHKTVAEFKQEMAGKELEKQLIKDYRAPEYFDELDEKVLSQEEFQELYKDWQKGWERYGLDPYRVTEDDFRSFLKEEDLPLRETTLREKIDWVENQHQGKIKSLVKELKQTEELLESKETTLESISEEYDKKAMELSKIDSEASQRLSELSEIERQVKLQEEEYTSLGDKIKGSRSEYEKISKTISDGSKYQRNVREVFKGEVKKTAFGKEYVRMSPEDYGKMKSALVYKEHEVDKFRTENSQLKSRLNTEYDYRMRVIDERDSLKQENKWLVEENKGLYKRLDAVSKKYKTFRDNAKKLMPQKEFKALTKMANTQFLEVMNPVVSIAKKVITKAVKSLTL